MKRVSQQNLFRIKILHESWSMKRLSRQSRQRTKRAPMKCKLSNVCGWICNDCFLQTFVMTEMRRWHSANVCGDGNETWTFCIWLKEHIHSCRSACTLFTHRECAEKITVCHSPYTLLVCSPPECLQQHTHTLRTCCKACGPCSQSCKHHKYGASEPWK